MGNAHTKAGRGGWTSCRHCDEDVKQENYRDHVFRVHPDEAAAEFPDAEEERCPACGDWLPDRYAVEQHVADEHPTRLGDVGGCPLCPLDGFGPQWRAELELDDDLADGHGALRLGMAAAVVSSETPNGVTVGADQLREHLTDHLRLSGAPLFEGGAAVAENGRAWELHEALRHDLDPGESITMPEAADRAGLSQQRMNQLAEEWPSTGLLDVEREDGAATTVVRPKGVRLRDADRRRQIDVTDPRNVGAGIELPASCRRDGDGVPDSADVLETGFVLGNGAAEPEDVSTEVLERITEQFSDRVARVVEPELASRDDPPEPEGPFGDEADLEGPSGDEADHEYGQDRLSDYM